MTISLRPYQNEAIHAFEEARGGDENRFLLTMATGAGKTVVTSVIMRDEVKEREGRALFLVHRDELIQQTIAKLKAVDKSLRVGVIQGKRNEWGDKFDVSVASVQSISRASRLEKIPRDHFTLIIIDETHRATANTYRRTIEHFRAFEDENPTTLLGITATADRTDGTTLDAVYQRHIFNVGILELIEQGFLVPIKALMVETEVDLSGVARTRGDFAESELASILNTDNRNTLIAQAVRQQANDRKTIVFAVNIEHAEDLAKTLRKEGVTARAVHGKMTSAQRTRALSDFRKGRLQALVSVQLLVEGYDEPSVSCVVWATKTMSSIKFAQGIGRGTRLSPETGKTDLLVIDCADTSGRHSKSLQSVPSMFGIDVAGAKALQEGADVIEAMKVDEEAKAAEEERKKREAEEKERQKLIGQQLKVRMIDLFAKEIALPPLLAGSKFPWLAVNEARFMVPLFEDQLHLCREDGEWRIEIRKTDERFRLVSQSREGGTFEQIATDAEKYLNDKHRARLKAYQTMRAQEITFRQRPMVTRYAQGKAHHARTGFDAFTIIARGKAREHFARVEAYRQAA